MFKTIARWITLCCVLILTACGAPDTKVADNKVASNEVAAPTTKIITNPNGDKITIPAQPKRIVDLSGSTEELLILGKRPVATMNADYGNPQEITPTLKERLDGEVSILGWYGFPLSIEAIAAENPDVIILGKDFNTDQYEALSQIAPTVALPFSYYEWRERLTYLASTFGEESKKDDYLAKYDAKSADWKQKLQAAVNGESFAVIETYPNNLVIYSNKGAAEMLYGEWGLQRTKGIPDPEGWGGKQIALEALVSINPDRLLLMENSENKMADSRVWNNMSAVKNEKVYTISNVDNYNYSYSAMGRMELMDRLGTMILKGK
ncbi:ABC transporter substrate-binding protein [Paenibacillus barcinonensis]|uniref:ABC transporter substrate-binding protein n=1 Tax=Paenibacillus barcinonensis TaxID=198119 RepID=A0A2V4VR35_PAEBA|nr:ABC transporter substrate-binding protein [Paenibacillus barcinonensis]PYE49070.1 iron complex transport system substrate-binding protein [Paenibacillus barcinonensis]QKS55317.1 ABC transporter substrate-binding protein [Paenibacillus barcinonensis]